MDQGTGTGLGERGAVHDHVVQFYDSDAFLVESVRDFILPGLRLGEAAIIVATEEHRKSFDAALTEAGVDLAALSEKGQYISLDAAETLERFMSNGSPDRFRFQDALGGIIGRASQGPRGVRIFGEMVSLLWAEGNVPAAVWLEELWNDLADTHPFSLFCAYPMTSFDREVSAGPFKDICDRHSQVVPSESYSRLANLEERMREVASLQQKARAGRRETEALRLKHVHLETSMQHMEAQDRLRNEFIAMVVHDLRTPTAVISGFLELLRANWTSLDQDQIDEMFAKAIANTTQIEKLIDDILTVAKLETDEFTFEARPMDLVEAVYRAVGGIRQAARQQTRFKVSVPEHLPPALADEARQLQILNNLLSNAVRFSPPDSSVYVGIKDEGDQLVVSVRDEGVGIAEKQLPDLFQRFSRLRQDGYADVKGSGLGLYICKGLVEGQGGKIWVDSKPGEGSTFFFSVPVATTSPLEPPPAPAR